MTKWIDKSDSAGRFLDGGDLSDKDTTVALAELFRCLQAEIIAKANAGEFDLLLFEVNCDTGRLIAAASTSVRRAVGLVDGCSIRLQKLQDFWYDQLANDPSDEQFVAEVKEQVRNLGMMFRSKFIPFQDELIRLSAYGAFTYIVYGGGSTNSVYEEMFTVK